MSWVVRGQFSQVNVGLGGDECEWSAVHVDTQEEAEAWWNCRVNHSRSQRVVHTLWNPQGEVVRVLFQ